MSSGIVEGEHEGMLLSHKYFWTSKNKKNTKLGVTRCGFRGAKNPPKYVCDRGSTLDPTRGAHSTPQTLLAGLKGPTSKGR